MKNNFPIQLLSKKKKGNLTALESQLIRDMQKSYGMHNVIMAIWFSVSADIHDIARMLLQHCGVRAVLPPSLKAILPDKATAQKNWSPEKYQIVLRLAEATFPIDGEITRQSQPLLKVLESKIGQGKVSIAVANAVRNAVRKYGAEFTRYGIEIISWTAVFPEEHKISCFRDWLLFSSRKDWAKADEVLQEFGIFTAFSPAEVPQPVSIRLQKYFSAKANRNATHKENETLWNMLNEYEVDEIIHAMSCVPSQGFSMEKVESVLGKGISSKKKSSEDTYKFPQAYAVGSVLEVVTLHSDAYWRIEGFDGNHYAVSEVDFDAYVNEIKPLGTMYLVKAEDLYLYSRTYIGTFPLTEQEKDREVPTELFEEDPFEDEETMDLVHTYRDDERKLQDDYEDGLYDYSDIDPDGLESDAFLP